MSYRIEKESIVDVFKRLLSLRDFTFDQENVNQFWTGLVDDVQNFIENKEKLLQGYDDEFRYRDYYDYNQHANDTIKSLDTLEFSVFCLADELDLMSNILLDNTFSKDEKEELLDEFTISKISTFSNHTKELFSKKLESQKEDVILPFEVNPNYRIFFSGFSLNDIKLLPKNVAIKVINKLAQPLSESLLIPHSESVDHVKDRYGVPVARIQIANDYRIAYIRYKKSTIILGVTLKSGKDQEYCRYDNCAKTINSIYASVDEFLEGNNENALNEGTYTYLREVYAQHLAELEEKEEQSFGG